MEKYYRMVIDLCKDMIADPTNESNHSRLHSVHLALSNALTAAKVEGNATDELETLRNDILSLTRYTL